MTEHVIPAPSGTTLWHYIEGYSPIEIPIVGFRVSSGNPKPIILVEQKLTGALAVECNGLVVSLATGLVFTSCVLWAEHVDENPDLERNTNVKMATEEVAEKANLSWISGSPMQYGTKTPFLNKSFWFFHDNDRMFVFEILGGEKVPDDPRARKVNRDAYLAKKKAYGQVSLDYLSKTIVEEPNDFGGLL